ncbi:MAG: RrF2 family transcriptional regulator [Planctomycetota bacterium]|jgi:Rrf2 family protein
MKIPRRCQYALRAVFELGLRKSGQPVKIHEIAGAQNIPPRFLEVILNQLRHGGFVDSRRGSEGGYMLVQAPEDLTVGEVIRYILGPICMTTNDDRGPRERQCFYGDYAFKQLWENVNTAICQVCDNTTFAELIEYEDTQKRAAVPNYSI